MPIGIPNNKLSNAQQYDALIAQSNPAHFWKCDETSGTTLHDSIAANKFNLTLQGSNTLDYQQLLYGSGCLYSPAASAYNAQNGARGAGLPADITVPLNYSHTWELLLHPLGLYTLGSVSCIFLSLAADATGASADNIQASIRVANAGGWTLQYAWQYGTNTMEVIAGPSLNINNHHVVIAKDVTNHIVDFYVDGLLHSSVSYPSANEATGGANCNTLIQANGNVTTFLLSQAGAVSRIAYYGSLALTSDQILEHANASNYYPGA
ncbi:MAG: hypothetical protein KGJ90_07085 [Patescibacteria group bacterium]|nr:hypothetical protein [Patescibacteria group bacterium]